MVQSWFSLRSSTENPPALTAWPGLLSPLLQQQVLSSPCSQQAPASRAGSCQGTLPGRAQCHAHRGYELALVALPAGCSREGLGGVLRVHRAQLVPYRAAVYGAEQTANSKGHLPAPGSTSHSSH